MAKQTGGETCEKGRIANMAKHTMQRRFYAILNNQESWAKSTTK